MIRCCLSHWSRLGLLCLFAIFAISCAPKVVDPQLVSLYGLNMGMVPFSQPTSTLDLMAGYIPEPQSKANEAELSTLTQDLFGMLSQKVTNPVLLPQSSPPQDDARQSALKYWVAQARAAGCDILLVPQVLFWLPGDEQKSSALTLDTFLVDARETPELPQGILLKRTHFSVQTLPNTAVKSPTDAIAIEQVATGIFNLRPQSMTTVPELAQEALETALKELGL